jgi:hypothetical protein
MPRGLKRRACAQRSSSWQNLRSSRPFRIGIAIIAAATITPCMMWMSFSKISLCGRLYELGWPKRSPDRSFIARKHTTCLAAPVATAIAACMIGAQAPPPPKLTLEKKSRLRAPMLRMISTSLLLSIV